MDKRKPPVPAKPQIERVLDTLNSAFKADAAAINALMINRVPCNKRLADHPTVQVDAAPVLRKSKVDNGPFFVGAIGLLNGALSAAGLPLIASKWSEPDGEGRSRLLGFCQYVPPKVDNAR